MNSIYEIRVEVDAEVAAEYRAWLRAHTDAVVTAGGFAHAEIWALENAHAWVIRYFSDSRERIQNYLDHHAPALRAEGEQKFGGRFRIERKILSFQERVPPLTPSREG